MRSERRAGPRAVERAPRVQVGTSEQWFSFVRDAFDMLYKEGARAPKMMSVGLHMRLIDISTNGLQLYAPVPNPTSAYVRIPFEVPFDGIVEVVMADVTGMSTFELLSGEARGGRHELLLDATARSFADI